MKKYIAEGVATFMFMLIAVGCACLYGGSNSAIIVIPFAFGLSFLPSAIIFSDLCVCHLNPVVSLAMYLDKKITKSEFAKFVLAQCVATLVAMLVIAVISLLCNGSTYMLTSQFANNTYASGSALHIAMAGSLIVECILTCIFVMSFLSIKNDTKFNKIWFLLVSLVLFLVCLFGLQFNGVSINPIRSLFSALVFGLFSFNFTALAEVFIFILGPILGSLAGFWLFKVFCKSDKTEIK